MTDSDRARHNDAERQRAQEQRKRELEHRRDSGIFESLERHAHEITDCIIRDGELESRLAIHEQEIVDLRDEIRRLWARINQGGQR